MSGLRRALEQTVVGVVDGLGDLRIEHRHGVLVDEARVGEAHFVMHIERLGEAADLRRAGVRRLISEETCFDFLEERSGVTLR